MRACRFVAAIAAIAAVPVLLAATRDGDPGADPLGALSPAGRAQLARGEPVVEIPKLQGDDIAIVGAVRTTATADRLVAWSREITELYRGKYVPLTERFSTPARMEDLRSLSLEKDELQELRDCRPRRCKLKLSAGDPFLSDPAGICPRRCGNSRTAFCAIVSGDWIFPR